jgi:hypothetical protein
MIRGLR